MSGSYDVDYRIAVGCRHCRVFFVRKHKVVGIALELESPPVAVQLGSDGKHLYVAEMAGVAHLFTIKGEKVWSVFASTEGVRGGAKEEEAERNGASSCGARSVEATGASHTIVALCVFDSAPHDAEGILLLALASGDVRMYNGETLVSSISTQGGGERGGVGGPASGLVHGRYGRQGGVLVMAHRGGALSVKMLRRKADLGGGGGAAIAARSVASAPPLSLPKKTRLYLDMSQREREHAAEMHHLFQRDLLRLRLTTARAYVKLLDAGDAQIASRNGISVHLTVAVQVRLLRITRRSTRIIARVLMQSLRLPRRRARCILSLSLFARHLSLALSQLLGSRANVHTASAPREQRHCRAAPSACRFYIRLRALQNADPARYASLYRSWRRRDTPRDARGDRSRGANRRCARGGLQPEGHRCALDICGGSDSAFRATDRRGHVTWYVQSTAPVTSKRTRALGVLHNICT